MADLAFGQGDDPCAYEGEPFVNRGRVLVVAAEAIERSRRRTGQRRGAAATASPGDDATRRTSLNRGTRPAVAQLIGDGRFALLIGAVSGVESYSHESRVGARVATDGRSASKMGRAACRALSRTNARSASVGMTDDVTLMATDSAISLVLLIVSSGGAPRRALTPASVARNRIVSVSNPDTERAALRHSPVVDPVTCLGDGKSDPVRRTAAGAHGAPVKEGRDRGGRSPRLPGSGNLPSDGTARRARTFERLGVAARTCSFCRAWSMCSDFEQRAAPCDARARSIATDPATRRYRPSVANHGTVLKASV